MGSQSAEQKKGYYTRLVLHDVGNPTDLLKWVEEVPADEILAHRIVWAFVLCYSY